MATTQAAAAPTVTTKETREAVYANEYNPYENRHRPKATGKINTLINLVKGIVGTGILAMPEAFKHAGLVVGLIFCLFISFCVIYGLHLMFKSMFFICKRDKVPQITYPDLTREAFLVGPKCLKRVANAAAHAIRAFVFIYQFGVLCVYLMFIVKNIHLFSSLALDWKFCEEFYMVVFLLPLLLVSYIPNMQLLAPLSNVGNWFTLGALITIYYFYFKDGLAPIGERNLYPDIGKFPLFFGTCLFSLLSIGALLSIEYNMKDGSKWGGTFGVLNIGTVLATLLNAFTGLFGYWAYGKETAASVTLNLEPKHPASYVVQILFALAIFFSYSLNVYPAIEMIWDAYIEKDMKTCRKPIFWNYMFRTIMVFGCFSLSCLIPRLDLFISLFGAFCLSTLGVIFPPIIDICLRWPDDFGKRKIILVRDIGLLILGILGFLFGTYTAMYEIILFLMGKEKEIEVETTTTNITTTTTLASI